MVVVCSTVPDLYEQVTNDRVLMHCPRSVRNNMTDDCVLMHCPRSAMNQMTDDECCTVSDLLGTR